MHRRHIFLLVFATSTQCSRALIFHTASPVFLVQDCAQKKKRGQLYRRGGEREESLNSEFAAMMLPALLGLTIEPVASLVDTAFVSKYCGEEALSGVGVASSIFALLSKSFNFLQSATTSYVARATTKKHSPGAYDASMARVASAALLVAAVAGALVTSIVMLFGSQFMKLLGVSQVAVLRPGSAYLEARALAAPATLGLMALQGAFRGARDSLTPVSALCLATVANVLLDAILVPIRGAAGAAEATVIAQFSALIYLTSVLAQRCSPMALVQYDKEKSPRRIFNGLVLPGLKESILVAKSGSVLTLRTCTAVAAMQYTQVLASRLGAVPGAAHVVSYQLWLTVALLADAIAVALQALLADALATKNVQRARAVALRALLLSAIVAFINSTTLGVIGQKAAALFIDNAPTLQACASIWPSAVRSQCFCCLAFVTDGALFAGCDFSYCAVAMASSSILSICCQLYLAPKLGLRGVWLGLELMMFLRFATGALRIISRTGPWQFAFFHPPSAAQPSLSTPSHEQNHELLDTASIFSQEDEGKCEVDTVLESSVGHSFSNENDITAAAEEISEEYQ